MRNYHDRASRFIAVVSTQRKNYSDSQNKDKSWNICSHTYRPPPQSSHYLEFNDFMSVVQDIVDNHAGLSFLSQTPEFHSRYIQTVICRIFYHVNRSWSGKISIAEMRSSFGQKFLTDLEMLSTVEEINQFTWFFSYEHFYVIYCKFWELDKDHDLIINGEDLLEYNSHALLTKVIDR